MKKAAVIMGSDSDWPVVKGICQQLANFGIPNVSAGIRGCFEQASR